MKHDLVFYARDGKLHSFRETDPITLSFYDAVHSLAHQCRFNGHTSRFYSVAEHSVAVARQAEEIALSYKFDAWDASKIGLWALLHDIGEAAIGDITRPARQLIGTDKLTHVDAVEDRYVAHFRKQAGLVLDKEMQEVANHITKLADDLVVAAELVRFVNAPHSEVKAAFKEVHKVQFWMDPPNPYDDFVKEYEYYGGKFQK